MARSGRAPGCTAAGTRFGVRRLPAAGRERRARLRDVRACRGAAGLSREGAKAMNTGPEPRFAKVAAMIGDPTRARMLSALMGGQYLAAGELATAAGVTAQTASMHIAKLVDAELVVARSQGRHRYFRLADAEIGHALEALSLVAERGAQADKWTQGPYKPLKAARTCYSHLAGELGVALFEGLLARGTLVGCDG